MKIPKEQIISAINKYASALTLNIKDFDAKQFLWALSGAESSFGYDCKRRIEPSYQPGGYYYTKSISMRQLYTKYLDNAAASWGVWQMMYVTSVELGNKSMPQELNDPSVLIRYVIKYFNKRCEDATEISQLADAYNSGNFRDNKIPEEYIAKVLKYYSDPEFKFGK